jgi:mannose/fructose/N-acetylgalactosamine-specific phosphotransferase system component IID
VLAGIGLSFFNNFFVQLAIYLAAYFAFQKFIMGPLYRPPTSRPK